MTPEAIIERVEGDGVSLALSPTGTIKLRGDKESVERWLTVVRAHKPAIVAALQEAEKLTTSWLWQISYSDRAKTQAAYSPPATRAEVLARHPDAIAAEPFEPTIRKPSTSLSAAEEWAIRAWMASIGETDRLIVNDVVELCRGCVDSRIYFLRRASAPHRNGAT